MSLSVLQYTEKVFLAVGKGLPEEQARIYRTSIESGLGEALQRLGDNLSKAEPARRSKLQKSFSLTLSGGEISLSSSSSLLPQTIPQTGWILLSGVTQPLAYLPERADLLNPPPLVDLTYYTIFGDKILVRDSLGAIPSTTSLTVFGSYVPTISEVQDSLVDELVEIGIAQALGSIPPQNVEEDVQS